MAGISMRTCRDAALLVDVTVCVNDADGGLHADHAVAASMPWLAGWLAWCGVVRCE